MNHSAVETFVRARSEKHIAEIQELVEIESPSFDEDGIKAAVDYVESMFSSLDQVSNIKYRTEYSSGLGNICWSERAIQAILF